MARRGFDEADDHATLIDIRDDIDTAKQFVAALWLACQAPVFPREERAALCAVADAARGALEEISVALGNLIAGNVDQR